MKLKSNFWAYVGAFGSQTAVVVAKAYKIA
jgi:hypothetical protein